MEIAASASIWGTDHGLNVVRADGTQLPGWPQVWNSRNDLQKGNSEAVVGDVNGDGKPDVVVTIGTDREEGELRAYKAGGQ